MAGFLRRAALAVTRVALGSPSRPSPFSGLFLASATPSAAGHLGLARATPALRDLLTPGAFLLDATHALGAVVLRGRPHTTTKSRQFREVVFPEELARLEAKGDATAAESLRIYRALIDAEDGRYHDALDGLARLAAERPDRIPPRLSAAAVCDLLGRADEADRWLHGIPEDKCPHQYINFNAALVAAALGGAPGAVAGSKSRVASAAFEIIDNSVSDGKLSAFQIIITRLLKHAVKRRCKDLPLKHGGGICGALADAIAHSGRVPKDDTSFVLQASQALLSAVVLQEHPLSVERRSVAIRVAERDLARAVEEGNAASVSDLRLLLAFLAARDGRFEEALARYEEVARDDPSDQRPHLLAVAICLLLRRPECQKWVASGERLPQVLDRFHLLALTDELLVALALASPVVFSAPCADQMSLIVRAAVRRVDAALVSALRSKNMSVVERMEARAARAFLHAWMWSALEESEGEDCGRGTTTD